MCFKLAELLHMRNIQKPRLIRLVPIKFIPLN